MGGDSEEEDGNGVSMCLPGDGRLQIHQLMEKAHGSAETCLFPRALMAAPAIAASRECLLAPPAPK